MITNFNKHSRKDDIKLLVWIIAAFLFVAWLCSPPWNKFLQICSVGNNARYFLTKIFNKNQATEYRFHRNNAVYLAKMYPNRMIAINEMDKAIKSLPSEAPENVLEGLYKDRAEIKLFLGDTKGALNDFINSNSITFNESIKVALLFKLQGNYREAMSYCNDILSKDYNAYAGYACMADIYNSMGRPDVALKVWDLAIDRKKNNPRVYVDRANVKKSLGDLKGYESDIKTAREYSPGINVDYSFVEETLHPKTLVLNIQ